MNEATYSSTHAVRFIDAETGHWKLLREFGLLAGVGPRHTTIAVGIWTNHNQSRCKIKMTPEPTTFIFLSAEVARFLSDNEVGIEDLLRQAGVNERFTLGTNPAAEQVGHKEPVSIILASAAVIAAATPILKDLIRNLSGKGAVIRERRLIPVEDSSGKVVNDSTGAPLLQWVDVVAGVVPEAKSQSIRIKAAGVEISFGDK